MENSSFTFPKSENDFEIMSRIDYHIYYEIEFLCDNAKEILLLLKNKEVYVRASTYMHQCNFLIEATLDYIKNMHKTTIHFMKKVDKGTSNTCTIVHLKEIEESQLRMKMMFVKFTETAAVIFPGDRYPDYLGNLKAKMGLIEIVVNNLFNLEKTRLIRQKVSAQPSALKFEDNMMN